MSEPKWMQLARADIGVTEVAGSRGNPKIIQYFRDVQHAEIKSDEVSWCAAFLGSCLERSKVPSTRSLLARSYMKWGVPVKEPRPGDIAVFKRGSSAWQGHVAFFVRREGDTIYVLGGNQGNSVNIKGYKASNLLGYRRPKAAYAPPLGDPKWLRALNVVNPTASQVTLAEYAIFVGKRLTPDIQAALRAERDAAKPETIQAIVWRNYWLASGCDKLPEEIAVFTFDTALHLGATKATQMMQEAVGVTADGLVGKKTIAAAEAARPADVINAMHRKRIEEIKLGPDWDREIHRLNLAISTLARSLIGEDSISVVTELKKETYMTDTVPVVEKSWSQSLTIWGTVVTFLSTVAPAVAALLGWNITASDVQTIGDSVTTIIQAVGGLIGTAMALYGRARASTVVKFL